MKKLLLSLVALALLSVSSQAMTMQTVAGIGVNGGGDVRHYIPVMDGIDAVFGIDLNIPLHLNEDGINKNDLRIAFDNLTSTRNLFLYNHSFCYV